MEIFLININTLILQLRQGTGFLNFFPQKLKRILENILMPFLKYMDMTKESGVKEIIKEDKNEGKS